MTLIEAARAVLKAWENGQLAVVEPFWDTETVGKILALKEAVAAAEGVAYAVRR